jgi:hypothetical protein
MEWSGPASYVKIRDQLYLAYWLEEACNGTLGTVLINLRTMHDCGTGYHCGSDGLRLSAMGAHARHAGRFDVPIEAPGSVLVEMAQLQGEGSLRQTRAQILELSCAPKLELRIADLEDANALRRLSAEFISRINAGVDTGVVFRSAVAEIVAEDFDIHAIVDISDDRRQASLRITCTVGFDVPIEAPGSVLVEMAQLQGEGSLRQMRAQILELSCARAQSGWTITRAQFVNAV